MGRFENLEFLRVARDTAELKGISCDVVLAAVESALQSVGRRTYGNCRIGVSIDKKTGEISVRKEFKVVSDDATPVELDEAEYGGVGDRGRYGIVRFSEAKRYNSAIKVGDVVYEELPPIPVDHNSARAIKQKIAQTIKAEERMKQYNEYKDRVGELIYGLVKRVEYNSLMVYINGDEACLPMSKTIRGEVFRQGDRVKACIDVVKYSQSGSQIFLSRVSEAFVRRLFEHEIPEIYDGAVVIESVARDPGARTKVAVMSTDRDIDPVGACVGVRGMRIHSIINELNGEKIDVVPYSSDIGTFVIAAIAPAEVLKLIIDEDEHRIEVVVPEGNLSLAIGHRGRNVKLTSLLVGWKISIIAEADESARRSYELGVGTELFTRALNVEELIAQLLVTEGFTRVEDVAEATISDLSVIEGFDAEIATELKNRAVSYLMNEKNRLVEQMRAIGMSEDLISLDGMVVADILKLGKSGVMSLDDFAWLSQDDIYDDVPDLEISKEELGALIIKVRENLGWFKQ